MIGWPSTLGAALRVMAAAVALGAGAPQAQEIVRVRAGEHASYSRIALDISGLGAWEILRDGRRLSVVIPDRELAFDTRQIFPGRRVSRVTAARAEAVEGAARLILSLACACEAQAYEFQPGMLVIDIREPEGQPARRPRREKPPKEKGAEGPPGSEPDRAPMPEVATAATAPTAATDPAPTAEVETLPNPATRPAGEIPPAVPLTVEAAQKRLIEQLARAADQGLIAFREPETRPPAQRDASARAAPAAPSAPPSDAYAVPAAATSGPSGPSLGGEIAASAGLVVTQPAPEATVQLDARTAFDRDRRPPPPQAGRTCPDDALLDTASWGRDGDFYAQLSERRAALVEEFDAPSAPAGLAIARLYLRFGFGAEARQRLVEFGPSSLEAQLLADISRVVDGEQADADGPLATANACGGRIALWRLASGFAASADDVADETWRIALLSAFAELPSFLRRRIGPETLHRLLDAGAVDLAEEMRLLLDRAPGDHGDSWRLVSARLAFALGRAETGDALLREAARARGPDAAEALLLMAERGFATGGPLPAVLVEDLASAAFAAQGTDVGRRLLVAEILGRAGRDQLDAALEVISIELDFDLDARRAADLQGALRAILMQATAADVGPAQYGAAVLRHAQLVGRDAIWDSARAHAAGELTAIGLGNAALGLLEPALARGGDDARIAAARAHAAIGDTQAALAAVGGLEGHDAALARATALSAAGRHREAFAEAAPHLTDAPEALAELAWQAGAWAAALALPEDDPRRAFAAWMTRDRRPALPAAPAPNDGLGQFDDLSLAAGRAAVEAAADARTRFEEALRDG